MSLFLTDGSQQPSKRSLIHRVETWLNSILDHTLIVTRSDAEKLLFVLAELKQVYKWDPKDYVNSHPNILKAIKLLAIKAKVKQNILQLLQNIGRYKNPKGLTLLDIDNHQ